MVWMLVGNQLVMEGMSDWEVWNVKVNVMEGYEGAVCKVVKYPSHSKSGKNAKDPKMKVGDIVKSISDNNKATTDVMDKILAIQEANMKRLVEDDEKDKDREA